MQEAIFWTEEAERTFSKVIAYLKENWTDREVESFKNATFKVINLISHYPRLYRRSIKKGIREVVITPHNVLLYRIRRTHIELLTFFDTRQDPGRKKMQ